MPDDIIKEVIRLMQEHADPRIAESKARQLFGGERIYVAKDARYPKAERLGCAVAAGLPLRTAFEAAGVSRATGYRLLSLRRR